MKNVIIAILVLLLLLFAWLWFSGKNNLNALSAEVTHLEDSINHLSSTLHEISDQQRMYKNQLDSLYNVMLNEKKPEVKPARQYSQAEKDIHALILNLQSAWERVVIEKDPQLVISNFMPKYTTNEVIINTENIPDVRRHNDTNFEEHLKAILEIENIRIDYGPTEFLSTFIVNNIFTMTYKTSVTVKKDYQVVSKSNIICYVSGERYNDEWKVGNYNWTRYESADL